MGAYLTDHPPLRKGGQWYETRRNPLTGCTCLHTAESVMDTVGPDTGAEAVAEFIRKRSDPGSYHDLVDSDSWVPLVDLKHAAFHDGTGSNNWALSLSFACRTSDWARMSPAKRRGFLHQGARAFANQQLYRRHIGAPLTRLRLISKAQSDRGESGLIYHGLRDPGRRSDPGVKSPHLFPLDEFIAECRAELARVMPDHPDAGPEARQEDDMFDPDYHGKLLLEAVMRLQSLTFPKPGQEHVPQHWWPMPSTAAEQARDVANRVEAQVVALQAQNRELVDAIVKQAKGDDVDVDALVERIENVVKSAVDNAAKLVKVEVSVPDTDPAT